MRPGIRVCISTLILELQLRGCQVSLFSSLAVEPSARELWEKFVANPSEWRDSRWNKRSPTYPDCVHSTSKDAVWVDSHDPWIQGKLQPVETAGASGVSYQFEFRRRAGGDSERVSRSKSWMNTRTLSKLCDDGHLGEAVEASELLLRQGSAVRVPLLYRLLKGCIEKKDLVLGRRVHDLAQRSGHELNTFLASHIIRMYAYHGQLEDAKYVFTALAAPNSFAWFFIILGHAEHGQPMQAVELYRQMRQTTVQLNNHIFVAVLKACASASDLGSGKEVHADVLGSKVEPDVFVDNSLVDMYSKCGSIEDARGVFDKMSRKTVVSWNAMLTGYADQGAGREALALYASMQNEGLTPANRVTFISLLKACASIQGLHQGKQLHCQIEEAGLGGDLVVGSCLVDMYSKCGSMEDARIVFDNLQRKDTVTWNAMLAGYAQHGSCREALNLYASMQWECVTAANHNTFVCLLKACASSRALHHGQQLFAQIQERELDKDVAIGRNLVDMFVKCDSLEDARVVFDNLPTKDAVSGSAIIAGYTKCGMLEEAVKVFDSLPTKNVVTWNALLTGYSQHGLGEEALNFYARMRQEGTTAPDHVTYVCLLNACASVGALHQGKQFHVQIQERGLEAYTAVGNSLVDMYAKCGSLKDARGVFDRLPARNVVTWTALLNGYGQCSDGVTALQCFKEMQQQGVEPDQATFVCLLVACSHAGLVHEGQQYFNLMVKEHGIRPSAHHYNCMVDLLGRAGHLDEAEDMLLSHQSEADVVGWKSLLNACRSHGDIERGRRCFERLTKLEPQNSAAYVLLENIYANAGRWKDFERIEGLRKSAGAQKQPARAWIEVKGRVHTFMVGEEADDVVSKLTSVNLRLEEQRGSLPYTAVAPNPAVEKQKEELCGHAEKLALAYGLLNTPDGATLLVTKNLRMCNDCHSGTKAMSRIENREIIVRDAHRVHHFVNGFCSCGDWH